MIFSWLKKTANHEISDIQALVDQLTRSRNRLNEKMMRRVLKQENVEVLVVRDRRKIVGMGAIMFAYVPSGCSAGIEDVVVDEAYRGRGIGKKIMERLIAHARRRGAEFIELTSRPSRVAANKLYRSMEFKKKKTNVYRMEFGI